MVLVPWKCFLTGSEQKCRGTTTPFEAQRAKAQKSCNLHFFNNLDFPEFRQHPEDGTHPYENQKFSYLLTRVSPSYSSVSTVFILMKPLCGWASEVAQILLVKMKYEEIITGFGKLIVFADRCLFGFSKEAQWFRHPDSNFSMNENLIPYILSLFCNGTLLYFITRLGPANWIQLEPHAGGETCFLISSDFDS